MQFDQRGYLSPYEIIPLQWDDFVEKFVSDFPTSTTRALIFENFLAYLEEVGKLQFGSLSVWVNGSFVTSKLNPNDLDVVLFLDSQTFRRSFSAFEKLKGKTWHKERKIDAYFVEVFPKDSPDYARFTNSDRLEWRETFSNSRRHRDGRRYPKGFIELQL